MTDDELAVLWNRFKDQDSKTDRERLIVHYSPLVKFVAGRVGAGLPSSVDPGDLVSSGVFGLIDGAGDLYSSRMRNVKVMSGYSAIMAMLPSLGQVAFFALGGWLAMRGQMSLGTFLAFQTYLVQLIAPVRMTTW